MKLVIILFIYFIVYTISRFLSNKRNYIDSTDHDNESSTFEDDIYSFKESTDDNSTTYSGSIAQNSTNSTSNSTISELKQILEKLVISIDN